VAFLNLSFVIWDLNNPVIRKEQVYGIVWERLPAAIDLIRGWKAAPTGVISSKFGLPDKQTILII
jgi:hypothetical protein